MALTHTRTPNDWVNCPRELLRLLTAEWVSEQCFTSHIVDCWNAGFAGVENMSGLCSLRHHCINTIWPYVCNRSLSMLGFHASGFFHVAKMFLQTLCSDKCNYCTYLCIYTSAVRVGQWILLPASARWRFTSPTLVWNVPTLQHYSDVIDYYEQPDLPATSVGHGTCRWKTVRTLSMSVALFGVHSLQMVYHWWVNLNIAAIITK